ncbi:MAG: hypothetical protein GY719_19575 [bacterium]|nr:hypothetical protein [bacterium]
MIRSINGPSDLPPTLGRKRFTALVYDPVNAVTEEDQMSISRWLIANNCKYMCAWGKSSGSWDTTVDLADIERPDFDQSDDICITTWHDDESIEETLEFFMNLAIDPYADEQDKVILDLPGSFTPDQWREMANKAVNWMP